MSIVKKLLFVCAGNAQRSPTFEHWFKENKPQYDVRSTGTAYGYPYRITTELLEWADRIYVMDREQILFMKRKFPEFLFKTKIIGCSDQYPRDSPQLKYVIWDWVNDEGL